MTSVLIHPDLFQWVAIAATVFVVAGLFVYDGKKRKMQTYEDTNVKLKIEAVSAVYYIDRRPVLILKAIPLSRQRTWRLQNRPRQDRTTGIRRRSIVLPAEDPP